MLVNVLVVSADDFGPPQPFYIVSEDETKIFYFTPEWYEWANWEDGAFPETGLYYNTNPPKLIYLVDISDWQMCTWEGSFIFSEDMQSFAFRPTINLFRAGVAQSTAILFFLNGMLIKSIP